MVTEASKTDPNVVLVIPTLNEERDIEAVLEQLRDDGSGRFGYRVIVADGGSTDQTREIVVRVAARTPSVSLIQNPGRTQAAALNLMLAPEFADIDILIRADAHGAYPRGFVDGLVTTMLEKDAASVVIPMDADAREGCFQKGNAWIADSRLGAGGSPHRGGHASGWVEHGHHAAFAMDRFRALGGYDTDFIANEDAEFDRRLSEAGGRIWLESSIRMTYFPRDSVLGLAKQYFRYGVGRARTCLKHGVRPKARQLIPVFHVVLLALSALALPFTWMGWVWPVFYLLLVSAAGVSSAIAHRSPCGLAGGLALAVMHTAWGAGFLSALPRKRPRPGTPSAALLQSRGAK